MTKTRKKAKKRLLGLACLFMGILGILIASIFKDWVTIFKNKKESVLLSSKYDTLLEDEIKLNSELNKLQDPEYVTRYIREKYLYSKDGEIIIRIPEEDIKEE